MSKDDYAKELLWDQMLRRKNAFLNAMRASDVSLLPRVRARDRKLKWSHCSFYEKHEDAIPPSPPFVLSATLPLLCWGFGHDFQASGKHYVYAPN
jgi:hypothetical protein